MTKKKSRKIISSSNENPFNVKVNRNKHSVLGQKLKGTRGLPGVSHSVGNAKRKDEFHKKRIQFQKANKFLDKRLLDSSLSFEEQATVRLVEERKKKFKKNIFNLNDEEGLTHKGIPLEKHKSFNDAVIDSDDEEQLNPTYVKQAHFGGFMGDSTTAPKSRKEIIDELIMESKRKKQERKLAREKQENLVEKLDQDWKELHKSLPAIKAKKQKVMHEKNDPFDVILNELKFEARVAPATQLKTPEEIAREEKEKLIKLEEERNKRMMNPMDSNKFVDNQLSADSIYDGLDIQFETFDEQDNTTVHGKVNEYSDDDESGDDSSIHSENENEINDDVMNNESESPSMILDDAPEIPNTLEKFCSIVDNCKEELHVIIENILKDNIKGKSKQKLEKLEIFFTILLEYTLDSKRAIKKTLEVLDDVLPCLYSLAGVSPVNTAVKLLALLDVEQEFFQQSKGKKMKKNFPRFQTLVILKIISVMYSVSDFKHPVVTPAVIFMCDILSSPYAVTFQNTFTRLFISNIIYDCVSYSKRYIPEVLWFLNKTLELAVNNSKKFNLFVDEAVKTEEIVELSLEKSSKICDNVIKVNVLFEIIKLLHKFAVLYEHLQSYQEIFSTSLNISNKLQTTNYPKYLREVILKFVAAVESVKKTYRPLVFENKKPIPLKLFEPAFDSKYKKRKDDIQKKRKLVKSIGQKIRKEEKGMLREMRRENQVISSEKLKEKMEADEERKRKVKQLYHELSMQEGEYKKFIKKK